MRATNQMFKDLQQFTDLDAKLVDAAKNIKILSHLSWPLEVGETFLSQWHKGQPTLPAPPVKPVNFDKEKKQLDQISKSLDRSHPVGSYIYQTAQSFLTAAQMLEHAGEKEFTQISSDLYGKPSDRIGKTSITNLLAAEHFIQATEEFEALPDHFQNETQYSSEEVAKQLEVEFKNFFHKHSFEVSVDAKLLAKATAGSQRVRIRAGTTFTGVDVAQIAQHEGYVHSATILNGREQPHLKSFGLSSPRTTSTQEGLATFAEFITNTMDLSRLRRIALRIKGMHLGIEGADFIEVFKFFLESGQSENESFQSAARIFRGGNPKGGVVFTKDVVYLQGLMFLHTFLRKVIQSRHHEYALYLFIGRITLGDILALKPFIDSGYIQKPLYMPPWAQNAECLAAQLCYSLFASRINLASVRFKDFSDHELDDALIKPTR
jgi:uncharacterized protein (TIGR02421 family)